MADFNPDTLLAPERAVWVKGEHSSLLPDSSIVREWRNIPVEHRVGLLANLRARRLEESPKAQQKEYTGRYRIQTIEDVVTKDSGLVLRETMAFGLATTLAKETPRLVEEQELPSTPVDNPVSPAHEGSVAPVQQNYKTLGLKWINLDPNKLNAIMAERTDLTLTAITVGTESHTGPWYLLSRKPSWAEDGSGIYEEKWGLQEWAFEARGKKGDVEVTASRYIQGVPKNRVKAALDAEIALLGTAYGRAGFSYDQKIYWREDSADIITEATETPGKYDENTSLTQKARSVVRLIYKHADSVPDAAIAAQGVTQTVQGRITEDGDFDYEKETTTAVKQEVANYTSEISAAKTELTKQGKNLYDADIAAYGITATAGKVRRRSHTVNEDGTFDDVVSEVSSTDQTASTDGTHSDQHLDTADRTEDTEVHTAAAAPLVDVAFATQGTVVETRNAPNEDGTFRTEAKTVVSKEQQISDAVVTEEKFRQVKTDIGKNIKDGTLGTTYPVAATTGEKVTRSLSKNQDDTFDVTRDRDIAKTVASAETSSEISLFETVTTDVDRNNTSADTPPASQTPGVIAKVTNRINDYNRVDVVVETRTSTEIAESSKETRATAFETVAAITDRNEAAAESPVTTQTAGTIKTATARKNDFGKYDNTLETRTSIPVSTTAKETSATAFATDERITDRNQAAAATPVTTQTAGTIKTARAELNEFGKYDNTNETRTSVAASTTFASQSAKLTTEQTVTARNADAKADASGGGSGTIVSVVSRLNDFGKYDNETQTKTAVPNSETQTTETTALKTTVATKKRNADALEAGTGGGSGTIVRASGQVNEFGKYDTEKEVITPTPASVTQATESSAHQTASTVKKRNQAALEAATGGGSGTVVRASGSLNEFGLYDTEKETTTAVDAGIAAYAHVNTPDYTATLEIIKNATSAPTLGTDYGEVHYTKNEFGRYDGTKLLRTYSSASYAPQTGLTENHVQSRNHPTIAGYDQYRVVTSTYNVSYWLTLAAAHTAINGGYDGSNIEKLGPQTFMSKKVTSISASAWTDTASGAYSVP